MPQLKANKASLEKKQSSIIDEHKVEKDKLNKKHLNQKDIVESIQTKISEFEADESTFSAFKKSETYVSIQDYLSDQIKEYNSSKKAIPIISEINHTHYKGISTFRELQQSTNAFTGNFNEHNIFSFKVKLNEDEDFLNFASNLKEFVEEEKIYQYEKRVNERFAHIIQLIGRETTELNSKEAEIEKIIKKINDDFVAKNFVQAIKEMEMRTQKSSNSIVKLLIQIKEFNDENSLVLGKTNLLLPRKAIQKIKKQ